MISVLKFHSVLILTVILISTSCDGLSVPPASSDEDVIIIGAGPSGIAAATRLDKNGINVKVFEGQERIGGRIHSIKFGDAYVDLGAEWCHGEGGNIVYEMMKDSQILTHGNYSFEMADSNGNIIDNAFTEELHGIFDQLYVADGARNSTEEDTIFKAIKETFSDDPKKYEFAKLAYHTFNRYILSSEGSFSWFDPSALSDYKDCEGDHTITWNGNGYKTILEKLITNFDSKNKLNYLKEVTLISIDEASDKVNVTLANGEVHSAKHVIFTPSLGVLKHDHKTLFQPPLPESKVAAIEALGIGAVMKVMLYFPEKWWDQNASFSGYSFVWTQEDRDTLAVQFRKGPRKYGLSWLTNFMGIFRVEQNPNVLSCWFTGEFVPEIEKMNDRDMLDGINFALNKFLGKTYAVKLPDKFAKSHWYSNKFIRGTYSYQTIDSRKLTPSANIVLSEPIMNKDNVPKILFAGEATHPHYYATVHGAIESGFREAHRIIGIIKQ